MKTQAKARPAAKDAKTAPKKAAKRIRPAIAKPTAQEAKQATKPVAKASAKPAATKSKPPIKSPDAKQTKQALLLSLMKRSQGATINELAKATDWQAHSVRGYISGTLKKKMDLNIVSDVAQGRGRVYKLGA